tara:strand:- start:3497 stop:4774 length:1278 start_codon:yes stop_codon:yes gene_type:complete
VLDHRIVRENPKQIALQLQRRGITLDLLPVQAIAIEQRTLQEERSKLQSNANKIGNEVGDKIKRGLDPKSIDIVDLRKKGNELRNKISLIEEKEKEISFILKEKLLSLPNLPSEESPNGKSELDNQEIKRWGKVVHNDNLLQHWDLASKLKLLDIERSTKISQSRFVTLLNQGARLERALINFMLDIHTKNGYTEVLPPALVNSSSLKGSGQLPKFADESFKCKDDDLWLSPTAEVPLTSMHRGEIIPIESLPLRYVAYSPCFRREAGSYGKDTRGLIRLHQFNKVEIYWFTHPNKSKEAHLQITEDAESILKSLELPYRVVEICTGDLGFSAARTFDLEVWLPGAKAYREISSCSNCGDFQARRSSIRTKEGKSSLLVHTLNGSALAIGRTMAALLENGQQSDGSIALPTSLVPYFGAEKLQSN